MMRIVRLFARALALRCPNCGGGHLFRSPFHTRERCARCGLPLEREEGSDYFLGGMMLNIIVAELVFVGGLILWGALTWPTLPWDLFQYIGVPFMVIAPLLFYRHSKVLWLAFDLCFRPARQDELRPRHSLAAARYILPMSDSTASTALPPSIERTLNAFRHLGREEKMQALVSYSKKLEPLPERYLAIDRSNFTIPECQTRVDIIPERRDGTIHFYADVNVRQSPTIAAFLAILFTAINDEPPSTTLAIPPDFVSQMMGSIGLGAREVGLTAMVTRLKGYARAADAAAT